MNIVAYIRELIVNNECIILPGLGGFETHYKPAGFDKVKSKIIPPTKQIIFKQEFVKDNGLLRNYIVKKEKIEEPEANKLINEFILAITNKLELEGEYILEKIGKLIKDRDGKIKLEQFEEENFLANSFGLKDISVQGAIEENNIEKEQSESSKNNSGKNIFFFVLFLILFTTITLMVLNYFEVLPKKINFSIFSFPKNTKYDNKYVFGDTTNKEDSVQKKINEKLTELTKKINALQPDVGQNKKSAIDINGEKEIETLEKQQVYYLLVAGSFLTPNNAKKYQEKLQLKGYSPEIIQTKEGFYCVVIEKTTDKERSIERLRLYRKDFEGKVWVMRY